VRPLAFRGILIVSGMDTIVKAVEANAYPLIFKGTAGLAETPRLRSRKRSILNRQDAGNSGDNTTPLGANVVCLGTRHLRQCLKPGFRVHSLKTLKNLSRFSAESVNLLTKTPINDRPL